MKTGSENPGGSAVVREAPGEGVTHRLRAIVLLAGSVRPSDLSRAIGRSELDLPVAFGQTILTRWGAEAGFLAVRLGQPELRGRVVIAQGSRAPALPGECGAAVFSVERDPRDYAGTGGLLRDLTQGYDPDDKVLVANAASLCTQPLHLLVRCLEEAGGAVTMLSQPDGTALGLMLASCRALTAIRGEGFVDLKEQALPQLAREFDVRVATTEAASFGVRTLDGYLGAVRTLHRMAAGVTGAEDPYLEDWFKTFEIVEDGAEVSSSAIVHDSVVLRGARVGAGAVVVRSVVGPGGVVRANETVSDLVVGRDVRAGEA